MKNWREVPGLVSDIQCEKLIELANNHTHALEIGSYLGKSTLAIAESKVSTVLSIDTFNPVYDIGDGIKFSDLYEPDFKKKFLENIEGNKKITSFAGSISDYHLFNERSCFDFFFIDGDHSEEAVCCDYVCCRRMSKVDSTIVFHDYGSHEGVTSVVRTLVKDLEYVIDGTCENMVWGRFV